MVYWSPALLVLALLSLCQILFLPGFLALKFLKIETHGKLQKLVYIFSLSLFTNYFMVMGLYSLKLYLPIVLKLVIVVEYLVFFAWLLRNSELKFGATHSSQPNPTESQAERIRLQIAWLLAFASIFSFVLLAWNSFGSIFNIYDDIVSWDYWATRWAGQLEVNYTSFYPQLLPCNWSIIYVLIENTDVKMFAKAIMPFFPLATFSLFIDGYLKTKNRRWLYGTACYALILHYLFNQNFLAAGYADVPCAFFSFLAYYAIVQLETGCVKDSVLNRLLPLIFASAAASTKQGALYVAIWTLGWLCLRHWKRRDSKILARLALSITLALGLNHWYFYKVWRFSSGCEPDNLAALESLQMGRSYWLRWIESFDMLRVWRGFDGQPFFLAAMALITASLRLKQSRIIFFTLVLPIYTFWALHFSYAVRNLGLILPFIGLCCGCGLEVIETTIAQLTASKIKYKGLCLARELVKSLAILLLGTGVSIFVCLQPVHSLTIAPQGSVSSDKWLAQLANLWSLPIVLAATTIALKAIASNRNLAFKVPIFSLPAILLLACGYLAVFENTVLPRQKLIDEQLALRRKIVAPKVNAKLYECIDRGLIKGRILTNYIPLQRLPGLEQYFGSSPLLTRKPLTISDVETLAHYHGASAMLIWSSTITPELLAWLNAHHYEILFEESGRSLVSFPAGNTK